MISSFLNIINEQLLHIVTADSNTVLFVGLTALLSEGVSNVIVERGWQFPLLLFARVVAKTLCCVEKWSTVSIIFFLAE